MLLTSLPPIFIDYGQVIGGSVGGVLGLLLVIAVIVIVVMYYKCRKTGHEKIKSSKVAVKYTQGEYGAAEEVECMTLIICLTPLMVLYTNHRHPFYL